MEPTGTDCQEQPLDQNDLCDSNPDFAVICSFIDRFGDKIDIELDIERLKIGIEERDLIDEGLIDIHVKLIKKIRRYFVRDQWEKALIRYAAEYSYEDSWEIERLGYLKTRPSVKLELLRRLLDSQFEHDQKFKALVNSLESNDLRPQPTGRDIGGNTYWHNTDREGNLRVFQEEPLDYKSWKAVCKSSAELAQLIDKLESNRDLKLKGEPMLDPYNPLPEIFPHLFEQKVEEAGDQQSTKQTTCKNTKKGRGRGRNQSKKTNFIPTLREEEDENTNHSSENHKQSVLSIKVEIDGNLQQPVKSCPSPDNGSIESHVKTTVESLINRVVSSIDYFLFKPLTKNFTDSVKQENDQQVEKQDTTLNEPAKFKQNKRKKREKPVAELAPRRSSSRIQQLQQKKEQEEFEKIVELTKKAETTVEDIVAEESDLGAKVTSKKHSTSGHQTTHRKADKQRWRSNNGKKKRSWDKDDSDLSSVSSITESEEHNISEDDPTFVVPDQDIDDEFACEDEDTNPEPVIIKRARTARQSLATCDDGLDASSILEEDKPCGRCGKSNDPEYILLCDMCDDGYHLACCVPPLMIVPDGDWFCPSCEHKTLLTKLTEIQTNVNQILEEKERERMKRERLRATANARRQAIKEERLKEEIVQEKRHRDALLPELSEPLAVQQLDEEIEYEDQVKLPRERSLPSKSRNPPRKKAKRKARRYEYDDSDDEILRPPRRTYSRRTLLSDDETDDEFINDTEDDSNLQSDFSNEEQVRSRLSSSEESYESDQPKTRRARACVSYKFKEYDDLIKSAIQGESAEEDAAESKSDNEPEARSYGRGKDMATIEALAYQQENGMIEQPVAESAEAPTVKKTKSRRKGRRLNDLDAESEIDDATSDESFQASSATEVEEEEDVTDFDTEGDSSLDELVLTKKHSRRPRKNHWKKRRVYYDSDESSDFGSKTRRAASKQISYKESTDEDEDHGNDTEDEDYINESIDEIIMPTNSVIQPEFLIPGSPAQPKPFYADDEIIPSPTPSDRQRTW